MHNFLTSEQVSLLTGISRRVIQELAQHGKIPCERINRMFLFRKKDIEGMTPRPVGRPANGSKKPVKTQRRRA